MLTKRVLQSALEGEITDHVGYEKHDPGREEQLRNSQYQGIRRGSAVAR
jgi:transposase-like protein